MAIKLNKAVKGHYNCATYLTRSPEVDASTPDWLAYGSCFLGRDDAENPNTLEAWSYPISDGKELSLSLLHTAVISARAKGLPEIAERAEELLCQEGYLALTEEGDQAELLIYGDIGGWDEDSVTAAGVVRDLRASKAAEIHVRINSFGGSVSDGLAIYNALRRNPATVITHIDGMAASIASLIAAAGDSVEASTASMVLVHAPWTIAMGNAKEMRGVADTLDVFGAAISSAYAPRLGKQKAKELITDGKDHWWTAAEALAAGLVDTLSVAGKPTKSKAVYTGAMARFGAPIKVAALGRDPAKEVGAMPIKAVVPPDTGGGNVIELEAAARAKVAKELAERNAVVAKTLAPFLVNPVVRERYEAFIIDPEASAEDFQRDVLAELGRNTAPVGVASATSSVDSSDKYLTGAAKALLARSGIEADDPSNEYRGTTMVDLARAALRVRNVSVTGRDKMSVVAEAFTHTSSDFPLLLADVARKSVLKGWAEQAETFGVWTAEGTLPDFKPLKRVDLNLFPSLIEIPEGGEYQYGTIGEHGESVQLATYGRMFSITRKAIINDDLNAFAKIPQRMGRAAKRTIGNLVYAVLTGNPNLDDGVALFAAGHGNLLTAAAISTTTVDEARVAMQTQKDPDGFTTLNIRPKFLLVPAALEGTAKTVMTSQVQVPVTGRNYTTPNSVANLAEVISEARLDAASALTWYLVASASAVDTIEVDYLDGQRQPYLEQQRGWEVDGVAFKVRMDAGVKALDYRGITMNPGA